MQTVQGSMLQSLRAVEAFLDENAAKLAGVAQTGARKRLADAITALDDHASTQSGSALQAKGLTQKQYALRATLLKDHMASIARIARADLPATPEFLPLRMPRGRPTPERLAAAASGMAKAVGDHADVFVNAGLPQDFVAQLTAAKDDLLSAGVARQQSRGRGRAATTGLKQKLSEGRKVVAILDAFVRSALKDDPALLANWNLIKRVMRPTGRAATASTPASPPAGTPSSAPTTPTPAPTPPQA